MSCCRAAEQDVFGQLSVFAGDFALAQAAQVSCGGDEAAAFDLVDSLASKSLMVADIAVGRTRYRLLETIRQYAVGRLAETGDAGGPAAPRRGIPRDRGAGKGPWRAGPRA